MKKYTSIVILSSALLISGCTDIPIFSVTPHNIESSAQNTRTLALENDLMNKCISGDGLSCRLLGDMYYLGKEIKQDYPRAAKAYKKACDLKEGLGCSSLGFLTENGYGVMQDYFMATELYQKACNLNDAPGCNGLGFAYETGRGIKQNLSIAKLLYGKSCDLKFQNGCTNYARLNLLGI